MPKFKNHRENKSDAGLAEQGDNGTLRLFSEKSTSNESVVMVPGFRSIIKIILIVFIVWAYLEGPRYFATPENRPVKVNLGRLKQIIVNTDKQILVLEKGRDGQWRFDPPTVFTPDPAIVNNLTWFLGNAHYQPSDRAVKSSGVAVTLKDEIGRNQKIILGARLIPFKKQLIQVDDTVFEVNKDISACLGFWTRMHELKLVQQLGSATAFDLKDERIRALDFSNPVVEYRFKNSGGKWYMMNSPNALIKQEQMGDYLSKFSWLSAFTPASRYVPDDLTYPYRLAFSTEEGKRYELTFSEPFGKMLGSVNTKMTFPVKKTFIIDSSSFFRLVPSASRLVANMPGFNADPKRMTEVKVKTKGVSFTMVNENGRWVLTKPSVAPGDIMMVEGVQPGAKMPATNAFVQLVSTIGTSEYFNKGTARNSSAVKAALAKEAGSISIKMSNGKRTELKFSPVIAGTESRFVSVGKTVLVISAESFRSYFPSVDSFRKTQ